MQRSDIPRKTLKMISYFIKVMHYTQKGFNISPYAWDFIHNLHKSN